MIAESAGLGNITKPSLEHNLSRFRKEVNSFREKHKISYQKKRDSQGEELSFGQQGYFKNSKTRDVRYNLSLTDSILEYMSSHGYDVDSAVDKAAN